MTASARTGSTADDHRPSTRKGVLCRLAATTALMAAFLVGIPAAASYAHSELESSAPAPNAQLARPPKQIELVFNQQISPRFANIAVALQGGRPQPLSLVVDGPRVLAQVPAELSTTPAGSRPVRWQVAYRVVSADGHPITGTLRFRAPRPAESPIPAEALASPAPTSSATQRSEPEVTPRADDHSRASSAEPTNDSEGSSMLATLVIAGLTGAVALGAAGWLARGRRRGDAE